MKRLKLLALIISMCIVTSVSSEIFACDTLPVINPATTTVDANGLETSKTVTQNPDGTYKISIESYATGNVTATTQHVPADIVMVLDQSESMLYDFKTGEEYVSAGNHNNKWYDDHENNLYVKVGDSYYKVSVSWEWKNVVLHYYTYSYTNDTGATTTGNSWRDSGSAPQGWDLYIKQDINTTRLAALKSAATTFVNNVNNDASANSINHRIAIVGFSSNGYTNTEILTGVSISNNNGVQYNSSQYYSACQGALVDANNSGALNTNLTNAINALTANGGTQTQNGMQMAKDIFDNPQYNGEGRNKIVILFTDGEPGNYGFDSNIANPAIDISKQIKDNDTKVYSIGVFDGADPADTTTNFNKFMNLISSNYPSSTSLLESGTGSNAGYYKSASNTEQLTGVFETITSDIANPNIQLGTNAFLYDEISDYFELVENSVAVQTADCTGMSGGEYTFAQPVDSGLSAIISGKTIAVTGFDYSQNFVSATLKPGTSDDYGKKLIVSFNVRARDGFYGGNDVPTNTSVSGIYDGEGNIVETFDVPTANVPIAVPFTANSINIYAGNPVDSSSLYNSILPTNNWKDEYVNINHVTYSVTPSVSNVTDGDYTVTAIVRPLTDGINSAGNANDVVNGVQFRQTAHINVFTPTIDFKDSTIYLGEAADYDDNIGNDVIWKHGDVLSTSSTMQGTAPALIYTYNPVASDFDKDAYVNISSVTANGTDITSYSDFTHTPCSTACEFDSTKGEFIVHVKTCSLTITKAGCETKYGDNQAFIINIKGNENGNNYEKSVDLTIAITGNNSKTIVGLPVGNYTITEDTEWSWRYETRAESAVLSNTNDNVSVTISNQLSDNHWLSGSNIKDNVFVINYNN